MLGVTSRGRNDFHRKRNHLSEYLREGSQELRMKAVADIHMMSPRSFKTKPGSYTNLNVGGLVALSRHLAVFFLGLAYVCIYIYIYIYLSLSLL